jgi:hypothetical protein
VLGIHAVCLGDRGPAVAEIAAGSDQDLVLRRAQIHHGRFHAASARGRENQQVIFRKKDPLQASHNLGQQLPEGRRAVVDDRLGGFRQHRRRNVGGARRHQTFFIKHKGGCLLGFSSLNKAISGFKTATLYHI